MGEDKFRVEQVDHIHVIVTEQYEAARWYGEILGLEIQRDYEDWAADGGPLTVSSDGGNTGLALFNRSADRPAGTRSTVAFRVGGEGFIEFLARLERHDVRDAGGGRVTRADVVDHDKAFSIYFSDPDGNPYELTTYDYQAVRGRLGR